MATRHIPASNTAHPNVTPLIDIIMCLIVFFMLVAKIGVDTGAQKIEIPTSILGTSIKDMGNTLVLNIPGAIGDEPQVEALVAPADGGKPRLQTLSLTEGPGGVSPLQAALMYYKKQKADLKVIIRASSTLEWRFISPVLTTCNAADIQTIEYNTKSAPKH